MTLNIWFVFCEDLPHVDVRLVAKRPDPSLWTDPGWVWCGDSHTSLPTFIRTAPKSKPGFLPAGLASTPADARRRWALDKYRYPPYQYKRVLLSLRRRAADSACRLDH